MCAFFADLQQAMEKAMGKIGMIAHVPAFGRQTKLLSSEEQALLQERVAELENKLQALAE